MGPCPLRPGPARTRAQGALPIGPGPVGPCPLGPWALAHWDSSGEQIQKTIRILNSPLFTLTKEGDYKEVRFNISQTGAIDCPPELMEKFYKAYRRFAELLHNKQFCVNFKLKKGDILSFDNRRVVHGRTEYDPNSGHRHLQGYYMDRDEIISRLNYLKKIEL